MKDPGHQSLTIAMTPDEGAAAVARHQLDACENPLRSAEAGRCATDPWAAIAWPGRVLIPLVTRHLAEAFQLRALQRSASQPQQAGHMMSRDLLPDATEYPLFGISSTIHFVTLGDLASAKPNYTGGDMNLFRRRGKTHSETHFQEFHLSFI
jgi:hypothetical protein